MTIYKETYYRGHKVWSKPLEAGEGVQQKTSKTALYTLGDGLLFEGLEVITTSQIVESDRSVLTRESVSFIGQATESARIELIYREPVAPRLALVFDEAINNLSPFQGKRPTVIHRLSYKPQKTK